MDENQTKWKSYSIAAAARRHAGRQFNQPDELYIAAVGASPWRIDCRSSAVR